jgi:multidrug resistance efflux pump
MVRFINKTKVPAEAQGKLTAISDQLPIVEEGMSVKKGDILAKIDVKQAELTLKMKKAEEYEAKLNAQNDVNLRDAVATEKIAAAEAKTYEDLYEKSAAPYWEWRKKQAEADRAKLRIELAELNGKTALAVYDAKQVATQIAEADVEMRTIRAEFDAFVENRFAQLGEWVQPGSPIVELVQMDRVRVEGFIDALSYAGQVRIGLPVEIEVTVGGTTDQPETKRFQSVVEYVSTEIDINNRHRIWASIPNQRVGQDWMLKPGMRATMRILPDAANSTADNRNGGLN